MFISADILAMVGKKIAVTAPSLVFLSFWLQTVIYYRKLAEKISNLFDAPKGYVVDKILKDDLKQEFYLAAGIVSSINSLIMIFDTGMFTEGLNFFILSLILAFIGWYSPKYKVLIYLISLSMIAGQMGFLASYEIINPWYGFVLCFFSFFIYFYKSIIKAHKYDKM